MSVYLHSVSTALPPYCLNQSDVRDRAAIIFGNKYPQFGRLSRAFDTAGIDSRYSVVPISWFSEDHGWADRNAAFMVGAKRMFIDAAQRALAAAGCHGIYLVTGNEFFAALAYTGYFLNLFNLMPTGFLDGGRMVAVLSPWLWVVGIVIAGAFAIYRPSFIIFLILIFSLPRLFSLFRKRSDTERRYFEVSLPQRAVGAGIYFGLVLSLGAGMLFSAVNPTGE